MSFFKNVSFISRCLDFREWRFQTCSYLGQVCAFQFKADWIEPGWSAAYYFNEAMFISTRQLARMISKKSEESQKFHFDNSEKFKKAVQNLPGGKFLLFLYLNAIFHYEFQKLHYISCFRPNSL